MDFLGERIYIRKMWAVLESWESVVANNSIDLGLSFLRDLGMENHG